MKIFFGLSFLAFLLVSCNNSSPTGNEQSDSIKTVQPWHQSGVANDTVTINKLSRCYQKIKGRDTVFLRLEGSANDLHGYIHFDNYQMDGSQGNVQGYEDSSLVKLWYIFDSEGMHSIMELVFRKTNLGLIRASGPMVNKNDSVRFKNYRQLNFATDDLFIPVNCQ